MIPENSLIDVAQRFAFLEARMQAGLPPAEIAAVSREWSALRPVVAAADGWRDLQRRLAETEALLADPEMRALAEEAGELVDQTGDQTGVEPEAGGADESADAGGDATIDGTDTTRPDSIGESEA